MGANRGSSLPARAPRFPSMLGLLVSLVALGSGTLAAQTTWQVFWTPARGYDWFCYDSLRDRTVYFDGNLTAVTQSYASGGAAAPNAVDAGTGGQADGGSSAPLLALAALAGVGLVAAGSRRMASAPAKR